MKRSARGMREIKETFSLHQRGASRGSQRLKKRVRTFLYVAAFLAGVFYLAGCATGGFGAAPEGPQRKLTKARALLSENNPRPAERLIRQALKEAEALRDENAIAAAYHDYGLFFNSTAVESKEQLYRAQGFLEKGVTFDTRKEKALAYLTQAQALESKLQRNDALAHTHFTIANIYYYLGEKEATCQHYDKSLQAFELNAQAGGGTVVKVPEGFPSYASYIADLKKSMACPE